MMTPVRPMHVRERAMETAARALTNLDERAHARPEDVRELAHPLRRLKEAERELLPPVTRVQIALHPWVAYGVMSLFAFANAGVVLSDIQELRYAEIAKILGIPEGTVKSRLFRGRRLLQRKLRGYAEEMGYVKAFALAS